MMQLGLELAFTLIEKLWNPFFAFAAKKPNTVHYYYMASFFFRYQYDKQNCFYEGHNIKNLSSSPPLMMVKECKRESGVLEREYLSLKTFLSKEFN